MFDSSDIRFRNVHVDSNSAMAHATNRAAGKYVRSSKVSYETCIFDADAARGGAGPRVRVAGRHRRPAQRSLAGRPAVLEPGAAVEKLSGGFYNISGAAVDAAGQLYFVDAHWQRIYRWSPETKDLSIVRDNPLDPVNLAFDKAGNLIVVSSGGKGMTVYSFRPDGPEDEITVLEPEPSAERPGMTAVLPVNYWVNGDFTNTLSTATYEYVSLDADVHASW